MLYESAARADEALCVNVEDLYPQDKRGKITAKGGATEWLHWQPGTAGGEEQRGDRLERVVRDWTKTFTDPRLCAAIVDRLTRSGAIIETGTQPYRLAHTKAQQQLKAVP